MMTVRPATAVIASQISLKAANGHRECGDSQIGFGLAAARREPEQIGESFDRLGAVLVGRDRPRTESKEE